MDTFGDWIFVKIKFKISWNFISKILSQVNYWHRLYFMKKKKIECVDTCLLEKTVIWCGHDILDPTFIIFVSQKIKKKLLLYLLLYIVRCIFCWESKVQTQAYETWFNIIVFSKPNNHFILSS